MIAMLQDGWALDWAAKALSPGVVVVFLLAIYLTSVAVKVLDRIARLEGSLSEMRGAMITKGDLALAIQEMGVNLRNWAEGRFLPRTECEQITNGHAEQLRDLRDEMAEHRRRSTDR